MLEGTKGDSRPVDGMELFKSAAQLRRETLSLPQNSDKEIILNLKINEVLFVDEADEIHKFCDRSQK